MEKKSSSQLKTLLYTQHLTIALNFDMGNVGLYRQILQIYP